MPCYVQGSLFICGIDDDGGATRDCVTCHSPAEYLCDWPVGEGTCDAPCCEAHAREPDEERHYCAAHWDSWERVV